MLKARKSHKGENMNRNVKIIIWIFGLVFILAFYSFGHVMLRYVDRLGSEIVNHPWSYFGAYAWTFIIPFVIITALLAMTFWGKD